MNVAELLDAVDGPVAVIVFLALVAGVIWAISRLRWRRRVKEAQRRERITRAAARREDVAETKATNRRQRRA